MRLGQEPKGIVGVGIAGERSENDGDPCVTVTFDKLIEKSTDEPYIDLQALRKGKFNEVEWTNQNLAVRVPGTVSRALEKHLWGEDHASARSRVSGTRARVSRAQAKEPDSAETAQLAESLASGAGFGDPETNRLVESAAVIRVTEHYRKRGWEVLDVSREKRGYDLECIKGRATQHVEVKGVAGDRQAINLTENERRQAAEDRAFVLVIVTSALLNPTLHIYTAEEMFSGFEIVPMVHRAVLRGQARRPARSAGHERPR